MAEFKEINVTRELLDSEPNAFYVCSDNHQRRADPANPQWFRTHPKAIGFPVQKGPEYTRASSFKPEEYTGMFFSLLSQLERCIAANPQNKYYIDKIGAGQENVFLIWEKIIGHNLVDTLGGYANVVFCWEAEKK